MGSVDSKSATIGSKVAPNGYGYFTFDSNLTSLIDPNVSKTVSALRDTGSYVTLLKKGVLDDKFLVRQRIENKRANIIVHGVSDNPFSSAPLYRLKLSCAFGFGTIIVGVLDKLPFPTVSLILGNDLLGKRVTPDPKEYSKLDNSSILDSAVLCPHSIVLCEHLETQNLELENKDLICPECVVTRAQKKKILEATPQWVSDKHPSKDEVIQNDVNISDTFFAHIDDFSEPMSKNDLIIQQNNDPSLSVARFEAVSEEEAESESICYYYKSGVLLRKFTPVDSPGPDTWSVKRCSVVL